MPISIGRSIAIILVVALATFATRAVPFVLFPPGKPLPKIVLYLGGVLPFAVIGMLVVYCLKTVTPLNYPYGLPELLAVVAVVLLHLWKRNNLLSIGVGTVFYMVLIQLVFV